MSPFPQPLRIDPTHPIREPDFRPRSQVLPWFADAGMNNGEACPHPSHSDPLAGCQKLPLPWRLATHVNDTNPPTLSFASPYLALKKFNGRATGIVTAHTTRATRVSLVLHHAPIYGIFFFIRGISSLAASSLLTRCRPLPEPAHWAAGTLVGPLRRAMAGHGGGHWGMFMLFPQKTLAAGQRALTSIRGSCPMDALPGTCSVRVGGF